MRNHEKSMLYNQLGPNLVQDYSGLGNGREICQAPDFAPRPTASFDTGATTGATDRGSVGTAGRAFK